MRFEHFLLTCFNVDRGYEHDRDGNPVRTPEWLDQRFELFERYCLPSVAAQTAGGFTWLVAYDERTPAQYLERLRGHEAGLRRLRLVPSAEAFRPPIVRSLREPAWLVTTRLDNDDALRRDAIARIQASVEERTEYLDLSDGYVYSDADGEFRLWHNPSGPFLTLVEPWDGGRPRTVMACSHRDASPVRQIGDGPMWLQVVHSRNMRNRLHGEECAPPDLAEFGLRTA